MIRSGVVCLVFCLLGVTFISSSYGLTCYQCRSPKVSDCTTDDRHQKIVTCGSPHPDYLQFCMFKVVYDFPLQTTVASSSCETVRKSPAQNWQTIERDYCQSGYNQQVHQCRICLSDLCNNPAIPYLQNAGPGQGPYLPSYGPGSYIPSVGGPGTYLPNNNNIPGPYLPNNGPVSYGYGNSQPRPPYYTGYYPGAATPLKLSNGPYLAVGVAAIVHLLAN